MNDTFLDELELAKFDYQKKEKFLEKYTDLKKCNNSSVLTYDKYNQIINEVEEAKNVYRKTSLCYRRIKRFDVVLVNGVKKLIVPFNVEGGGGSTKDKLIFYAHNEELFDIIHKAHLECHHGGRNRIESWVKKTYKNVTREAISIYLKLCEYCISRNIKSDTAEGFMLQFDDDCSEAERRFYVRQYPNVDLVLQKKLHCTVCNMHIGSAPINETIVRMHPVLRITHCTKCDTFYNSGEFSKGEDGSELYCRWCGQGGEVYCCSKCPFVFCKKCIITNLSRGCITDIAKNENWSCFQCSPRIMWHLRAQHWAFINYIRKQKEKIASTSCTEEEVNELMNKDLSTCCVSKTKRKSIDTVISRKRTISSTSTTSSTTSIPPDPAPKKPMILSARTMLPNLSDLKLVTQIPNPVYNKEPPAKEQDEVVCTPDILSLFQEAAGSSSNTLPVSAPPLRHFPKSITSKSQLKSLQLTPISSSATTPPVYHTINGFKIDLNSAAQQETYRLPNGKLIQVKKQTPNTATTTPTITKNPTKTGAKQHFVNIKYNISPKGVNGSSSTPPPLIIPPPLLRTSHPNTAFGNARKQFESRVHSGLDVCQHITGKINTLINSASYKTAKNLKDLQELHIHLSYLFTYAIGRIKSIQDKCAEDVKAFGFSNNPDSNVSDDDDIEILEPEQTCINLDSDGETEIINNLKTIQQNKNNSVENIKNTSGKIKTIKKTVSFKSMKKIKLKNTITESDKPEVTKDINEIEKNKSEVNIINETNTLTEIESIDKNLPEIKQAEVKETNLTMENDESKTELKELTEENVSTTKVTEVKDDVSLTTLDVNKEDKKELKEPILNVSSELTKVNKENGKELDETKSLTSKPTEVKDTPKKETNTSSKELEKIKVSTTDLSDFKNKILTINLTRINLSDLNKGKTNFNKTETSTNNKNDTKPENNEGESNVKTEHEDNLNDIEIKDNSNENKENSKENTDNNEIETTPIQIQIQDCSNFDEKSENNTKTTEEEEEEKILLETSNKNDKKIEEVDEKTLSETSNNNDDQIEEVEEKILLKTSNTNDDQIELLDELKIELEKISEINDNEMLDETLRDVQTTTNNTETLDDEQMNTETNDILMETDCTEVFEKIKENLIEETELNLTEDVDMKNNDLEELSDEEMEYDGVKDDINVVTEKDNIIKDDNLEEISDDEDNFLTASDDTEKIKETSDDENNFLTASDDTEKTKETSDGFAEETELNIKDDVTTDDALALIEEYSRDEDSIIKDTNISDDDKINKLIDDNISEQPLQESMSSSTDDKTVTEIIKFNLSDENQLEQGIINAESLITDVNNLNQIDLNFINNDNSNIKVDSVNDVINESDFLLTEEEANIFTNNLNDDKLCLNTSTNVAEDDDEQTSNINDIDELIAHGLAEYK